MPRSRTYAPRAPLHEYFQVFVDDIPSNVSQRRLRKAIGKAVSLIRKEPFVQFRLRLHRHRSGRSYQTARITFADPQDSKKWIQIYGERHSLNKVEVQGQRLRFSPGWDIPDEFELRAVRNVQPDDSDSDYDGDVHNAEMAENPLYLEKLECGAFDSNEQFCVGWTRASFSADFRLTFDIDEALLKIKSGPLVIESALRHIMWIYTEPNQSYFYIAFQCAPTFWQEVVIGDNIYLDRVGAFDDQHRQCAQHALVFRFFVFQASAVPTFFRHTKGRLQISGEVSPIIRHYQEAFNTPEMASQLQKLGYELGFQVHALVMPHKLLPRDILDLMPDFEALLKKMGKEAASNLVFMMKAKLVDRGPHTKALGKLPTTVDSFRRLLQAQATLDVAYSISPPIKEGLILIRSVALTPCYGMHLEGPHCGVTNSIIRQYPGGEFCFLRVRLCDEDGSWLQLPREYGDRNADKLIRDRYAKTMKSGLLVGGFHFRFLAFSNSNLRENSCWFVSNFTYGDTKVTASSIRQNIGDLKHIRTPARFAARLGQAFTSTAISIKVDPDQITIEDDVATPDGEYEFTDGIGKISPKLVSAICKQITQSGTLEANITAFQVRIGGAKGVLALDPRLKDKQIVLRRSMEKFKVRGKDALATLGISNYYSKPSPLMMNRQMIVILESLGVSAQTFLDLQHDTVQKLQAATKNASEAATIHQALGIGSIGKTKTIIKLLNKIGINPVTHVPFLHQANSSAVTYALRRIKYQCRIPVPECYTLLGILDESEFLRPGEVIISLSDPGQGSRYLNGLCYVGRSPMLHPGDIQAVVAKTPPKGHMLEAHRNVIIFSKKGPRPIPSMLSGGDLDGDLYNIIQHTEIMNQIKHTFEAADYPRHELIKLDRDCNVEDIIDFFLEFIEMQKVGVIANRHLQIADQRPYGARDPDCMVLAEMHSVAVDFPKSGRVPETSDMPRASRQRPDFMQKEYHLEFLEWAGARGKMHPRTRDLFYPSEKALGKLFRSIDTYGYTKEWALNSQQFQATFKGPDGADQNWTQHLYQHMSAKGRATDWSRYLDRAKREVQHYYGQFAVIAQENSPEEKGFPLTEAEVFMGHVFCRGPNTSASRAHDDTMRLRDDFEDLCRKTRRRVLCDKAMQEANFSRYTWKWLDWGVDRELLPHDAQRVIKETVEQGVCANDKQVKEHIVRQLRYAIQQGTAWVLAAFASKAGQSAEWIMVPSVLRAHQCLDVIEALILDPQGEEEEEEL